MYLDGCPVNGTNVAIMDSKEMTSNQTYSKEVLTELNDDPYVLTSGVEVEPCDKVGD